MTNACPKCGISLTERAFGSEMLDGCPTCGGIWFDYRELDGLCRDKTTGLMEVERAFNPTFGVERTQGDMKCPKCDTGLYEFSFKHTPSVRLDACPACKGIWVDDGELQAISNRVCADRGPKPPPPSHNESEREKARNAVAFLLSCACPKCHATNPAASIVCWQCGSPLKTRSIYHLCPRCDSTLDEIQAENAPVKVDVCVRCSGAWFATGELSALLQLGKVEIERIQGTLALQGKTTSLTRHMARCPGCHHGMQTEELGEGSGVDIDICPYCSSVWLDANELIRAYQYVQNGGQLRVSSHSDPWGSGE